MDFQPSVRTITRRLHPDLKLSSAAVELLNFLMNEVMSHLVEQAVFLMTSSPKRNTVLSSKELRTALRIQFPLDFVKSLISHAHETHSQEKVLDTNTVARLLRRILPCSFPYDDSVVPFLTQVLQDIMITLLFQSGNLTRTLGRIILTKAHLRDVIHHDFELCHLFEKMNLFIPAI